MTAIVRATGGRLEGSAMNCYDCALGARPRQRPPRCGVGWGAVVRLDRAGPINRVVAVQPPAREVRCLVCTAARHAAIRYELRLETDEPERLAEFVDNLRRFGTLAAARDVDGPVVAAGKPAE
jgi:hypothetical protein